jgi:glycosyltransferase involved in cell wall biosynthesis
LLKVGCPAEKITVVPYGCETVEEAKPLGDEPKEERPYFLWVGSGSHRKGLHHLCRAWEIADCAKEATLIVVARVIDPGMEPLLNMPGIRWVQGLPRAELNWYFSHARAFVMPSLSEGFGQVYLEALAKGCPVIGTRNSVLPDITDAQSWIDYVEPGNVEQLAERLKTSLRRTTGMNEQEKSAVAKSVRAFTWDGFRSGIETVLQRFD